MDLRRLYPSQSAAHTLALRGKIEVPFLEIWHPPEYVAAIDERSGGSEPLSEDVEM